VNRGLIAGAFAVALTIGGFAGHLALASGDGTSRVFYACVKDGSMIPGSVVVDTAPTCRGGAEVVSWNHAGPQGATGLSGQAGSAGPTGATGPAGRQGDAGPGGPTGSGGPAGTTGSAGRQGDAGPAGPTGSAGATGATGPAGSGGSGVKSIGGLVTAGGTLSQGHGVTAVKLSTGYYLLRFPAGTWTSFPAVVVSPFGSTASSPVAEVDSVIAPTDGSAAALVVVSSTVGTSTPTDAAFLFTATAT
jgi:hypothetical protein